MSVKYIPVQWNRNKWIYDFVMLAGVVMFLAIFLFLSPQLLSHEYPINPQVHNARAFGACAFIMLTIILCIGPLARIDRRFLPLLYNRRHFGVMTTFVAITHAGYILNWYFAFSKSDKFEALLFANTSYGQLAGFPFEVFGIFALICLLVLSATSHDFWMKFLTPPVWKRIHSLIYFAYVAVVAHVSLGILQDQQNHVFTVIFVGGGLAVAGLHAYAALLDRRAGDELGLDMDGWMMPVMQETFATDLQRSKFWRAGCCLQSRGQAECHLQRLRAPKRPAWRGASRVLPCDLPVAWISV